MYILCLHCDDTPGVVAAVATCLSNAQCNIEESSQFNDHLSGQFFMRVVFKPLEENARAQFEESFGDVAKRFSMCWHIKDQSLPIKTALLISKADHCLNDILYRYRTKNLNIDITAVISNHEMHRKLVEDRGLSYHYLPSDDKAAQEQKMRAIFEETGTELIVLARYMQVLSADMCASYEGRIINIHHSFLPGFKGAKPYHQAYERGVKIIGATAHFVTADLDEGPIIVQDTMPIDHSYGPGKLQILGRDTESAVLSRAIHLYTESRIFLHGHRTVIL